MRKRFESRWVALMLTVLLWAGIAPAHAATATARAGSDWPAHPLKLLVGYPPGGPTDVVGRVFAEFLGERLHQQVLVENRPGAGGNVAASVVAHAAPDGYTLLVTTIATHGIAPGLYRHLPFDPVKDFAPIREVSEAPSILVVTPSLPVRDAAGLIAYARAHPHELNFASAGAGTSMHLAGEMFKSLTGIDIVHVPYQGSSAAYGDLISGRVQMMIDPQTSIAPLIRSDKVRALAVASARPSTMFPQLPTLTGTVVPGLEISSWAGIVAPAGTPAAVVDRIATALDEVVHDDKVRQRLATVGAAPVLDSSPTRFAGFIDDEIAKWRAVIHRANIPQQ